MFVSASGRNPGASQCLNIQAQSDTNLKTFGPDLIQPEGKLLFITPNVNGARKTPLGFWLFGDLFFSPHLPGSVGAAGGPTTGLHCFVLVGTVPAVVALATQGELQRFVQAKWPVRLRAAQAGLHGSHLC